MIELGVDLLFLLYLGAGFAMIFGLWFYHDRRDSKIQDRRRLNVVFHCIKCGEIYSISHAYEECDCPQCGFTNGRLRF